jgi:thiosulfate/3-mercaptopyruvate sulfurtransferase
MILWLIILSFFLLFGTSGPGSTSLSPEAVVSSATPVTMSYAHPEWLVEGKQLQAMLDTDSSIRVVALTSRGEFAAGHIPGAAQIDWSDLDITDTTDPNVEVWRAEVEQKLTTLGITPNSTVVIYDGGTEYAPRLWWVLDQLGHADKRLLNGGLQIWIDAGGALETGESTVVPAANAYQSEPNENAIATIDEVQTALDNPDVVLVDARTSAEYEAGHIPGAVNLVFTENMDMKGRWLPAEELFTLYGLAGVTPDKTIIPYCTTGVRSAATYFTLRLLGYERVALFTGSFAEWSSVPGLPVERSSS